MPIQMTTAARRQDANNTLICRVGLLIVLALASTRLLSPSEGSTPSPPAQKDTVGGEFLDPRQLPAIQTKDGVRCTLTSLAWQPDRHPEKCGENMLTFAWQVEGTDQDTGQRGRWCAWHAGLYDEHGKSIPVCAYHWSFADHHDRRGDDPKRPFVEVRIACRRADAPPAGAYQDEERLHLGEVDLGPSGRYGRLWGRKANSRLGTVGVAHVASVRRADLPGGKQTPSLELVCLLRKRVREARPSFALKAGDVVDGQGRDLVLTLVASAPASAFGHNWPAFTEAWVFYFQPSKPHSRKLNISLRLRSGLAPEYKHKYFRLFKFRVKTPDPPAIEAAHNPLARQTKEEVTLTIEDCARLGTGVSSLYLVWTTVKGPIKEGGATEVTAVTAWDSEDKELRRYPGSPLLLSLIHI